MDDEYLLFRPHWDYDWDRGWSYYRPEVNKTPEPNIPRGPMKAMFSEEASKDLEDFHGIKL